MHQVARSNHTDHNLDLTYVLSTSCLLVPYYKMKRKKEQGKKGEREGRGKGKRDGRKEGGRKKPQLGPGIQVLTLCASKRQGAPFT